MTVLCSRTKWRSWVVFVVGSRPCSEGFSLGTPVSLPPQKPTFLNSNSTRNARTPLNELLELFDASWVNKLYFTFYQAFFLQQHKLRAQLPWFLKSEGNRVTGTYYLQILFFFLFNGFLFLFLFFFHRQM